MKKAKMSGVGIMISLFETGRFIPQIKIMNPRKQNEKSGRPSTIRTPAWPLLPQMWLSKRSEEISPMDRRRPVLQAIKVDPNTRD